MPMAIDTTAVTVKNGLRVSRRAACRRSVQGHGRRDRRAWRIVSLATPHRRIGWDERRAAGWGRMTAPCPATTRTARRPRRRPCRSPAAWRSRRQSSRCGSSGRPPTCGCRWSAGSTPASSSRQGSRASPRMSSASTATAASCRRSRRGARPTTTTRPTIATGAAGRSPRRVGRATSCGSTSSATPATAGTPRMPWPMPPASRRWRVSGPEGPVTLPRGDVLVFGGDQVYPSPSREEYQRRLVAPFTEAFGEDAPAERPHVYAIPGNHDWYDGLSAFTRLFCSDIGGRRFAGWWTRQRRSYFVLKLPHGWWLVGSDAQLQSDIDVPQMEYFRAIREAHEAGRQGRAVPVEAGVDLRAEIPERSGRVFDETDLIYLREEVFAAAASRSRCTCRATITTTAATRRRRRRRPALNRRTRSSPAAAGRFSTPRTRKMSRCCRRGRDGPGRARSSPRRPPSRLRRVARPRLRNLRFPFTNPRFGVVPAMVYLLTGWLAAPPRRRRARDRGGALRATLEALATHPGLALWSMGSSPCCWRPPTRTAAPIACSAA